MRYMGDHPLSKNQKDIDCIYFILQTLHHHKELIDEVYCQLVKQTTNNKSNRIDSCQKGWRLITIICAFYKASDILKHYLLKYLENNAYDSKRPFNGLFIILF
jgi:myosin-15